MQDVEYVPLWLHQEVVKRLETEIGHLQRRCVDLEDAEVKRVEERVAMVEKLAAVMQRSNTLNLVLMALAGILGFIFKGR